MSEFAVIGHRGFPEIAPENTLSSFEEAINAGAQMIECDVTLSKDGQVVVIHDKTLDRTTDGCGRVVQRTWDEIRLLDAGSWFSPKYEGEKVPLLTEVLDLVKGRCRVNVEIKPEAVKKFRQTIEKKVIEDIQDFKMEKESLVSSFEWLAVKRVKLIEPKIEGALLFWREMIRTPAYYMKRFKCDSFHFNTKRMKKKHIDACKALGIPVRVYTVNDPKRARQLKTWGVSGIFTDRTALMCRYF